MKNHRHSARITASLLTALLLSIGCGGGGSDDPPAPEPRAATGVIPTFDQELRSRAIDCEIAAIEPVE